MTDATNADLGSAPVRVLYFAGSGRSGTTIINSILGQVDGAFACGELRYLWRRGMVENRLCGCGVPFAECPVWSTVLDDAFGAAGAAMPDAASIADRLLERLSSTKVPAMVLRRAVGRRPVPEHADDAAIVRFYHALSAQVSGAVIVDSSKLPPYGLLLEQQEGIEVMVLHVIRDARATAFSWQRSKPLLDFGDDQLMPKLMSWKSSLLWSWWNSLTMLLWGGRASYLRIRYEDFVQNPQSVMEQVMAWAGLDPASLPFEGPTRVRLAPTHSVAGNPSRHSSGAVHIRPDDEWKRAYPRRERLLVTTLSAPVLLRFGYALGRGRRRTPAVSTSEWVSH